MYPFLRHGDKILVYRFAYLLKKPQINDVVVVKNPENDRKREYLLKRITNIQENKIFLIGDNKQVSRDSRVYGWINKNVILGKMLIKL